MTYNTYIIMNIHVMQHMIAFVYMCNHCYEYNNIMG